MKKRSSIIFSILVAFIAMILLSCSSVTNNLVEIDNIIYHECDGYYVADGPLKKKEDLYDAIIPEKINGKYVKEISDNAFDDCHYLVNVSIPSGVITIGEWAFAGCWRLNNITIPPGVTTIGHSAFGWTNLEEIIIPSSVENADSGLFSGCNKLEKIIVDENNRKYDSRNNCNAIIETETNTMISACKNTIIPNTIKSIVQNAFGWTNLKEIKIPSSIENLDANLFIGCDELEKIIVDENNKKYDSRNNCNAIVETETNILVSGCINTIIPNTVTSIGNYAFGYSDLEKIIIPANITSIGKYAFYGCDELEDVYYLGTLEQWNSFNLEEGNDNLISATCYIYSETQQTDITGLYWHYVDGVPTKW